MAEQTERPRRRRAAAESPHRPAARGNGQSPRRLSAADAARAAMVQIADLIGHDVDGVISVEHNDDDWRVGVEVVESHRIPDSADILASYEVGLDEDGELISYRRTKRYSRGQTFGGPR